MRTIILQHEIEWGYHDGFNPEELPESEEEHIKHCIIDGSNQGELNYTDYDDETDKYVDYRGWWEIVK